LAAVSEGAVALLADKVARSLEAVAGRHSARLVKGVRLDLGEYSQDYPYILIDRYGLLAIDVQVWPGSVVKGAAGSRTWTSKRKGSSANTFTSPLLAGRRRTSLLSEALLTCGRRLPSECFSYLVVFAGADMTQISVPDPESGRLVDLAQLEDRLNMRYDFATSAGTIEPSEIDDLVSLLRVLDRSDDHVATPASGHRKSLRDSLAGMLSSKRSVTVNVNDSAAGVAPSAPRLSGDGRYPSVGGSAAKRQSALPILLLALLILVAVWLFQFGGMTVFTDWVNAVVSGRVRQAEAAEVPVSPETGGAFVSVDTAERVLFESAPDIHSTVLNRGAPNVTQREGLVTFSWRFVDNRPGFVPGEKTIALTFDAAGNLRGVNME
jgi:hypothetical protein